MNNLKTGRLEILDIAKGMGILLVVIGHLNTPFGGPIYKFHMALFFIISGWCYSEKWLDHMSKFVWSRFVSILLPALIFVGVSELLIYIDCSYWQPTIKSYHLLGTIWFLKDLFKASVIFQMILWLSHKLKIQGSCFFPIILMIIAFWTSYKKYDSIALNSYIMFFYSLGYVLKKYRYQIINQQSIDIKMISFTMLGLGFLLMSKGWAPGHITGCNYSNYLQYAFFSLLGSYILIQGCYLFDGKSKLKKCLILIGQNTLPIMLFQWPAFWCVDLMKENGLVSFEYSILEMSTKFLVGISLPLLISLIYEYLKNTLAKIRYNNDNCRYL